MKQKDIALIMIVVFISAVASFFLSGFLFASSNEREQKVEVVDVIEPGFDLPSDKYFNKDSINPTQQIQIGEANNPDPFKGAQR